MLNRREFVSACGRLALAASFRPGGRLWTRNAPADFSLRIARARIELSPHRVVSTLAYNGVVPGPLIRVREGDTVSIDVANETADNELVHWHGLALPSDVDGSHEEGTPHVPAHGQRRYTFAARPAGTRWYHTHGFAGHDLTRAAYTGQFGFLIVDPASDPGRYDREIMLALHDWDPYTGGGDDGYQMVMYNVSSINDRLLGFADPIRVRNGERVLFRFLNASATDAHWLSLAGHLFLVTALDGNPVPSPGLVDVLRLAPGERVDALVTMTTPGVWVLGEPRDAVRNAGMGIVVEYANQKGPPQITPRPELRWDYLRFGYRGADGRGRSRTDSRDVVRVPLVFRPEFHGHGDFEHWTINGQSWPAPPFLQLTEGKRYRFFMDNQSVDEHPVHLHRHSFELTDRAGQTCGVIKDVVIVPPKSSVEVEFLANNRGATLFHCHQQDHMDAGFMALLNYV